MVDFNKLGPPKPAKGSVEALTQTLGALSIDSMLCQKIRGSWYVTMHVWDDVQKGSGPPARVPGLVYMDHGPTLTDALRNVMVKVHDAQRNK